MAKKTKTRETLNDILASCSGTLFPAEMGAAPVFLDSRGSDGDTPLHVMIWRGNTFGALKLIEAGADVNAIGDMSETALHIAVRKQNLTIIEALLKAGADVTSISEFGLSPRDHANEADSKIRRLFSNR